MREILVIGAGRGALPSLEAVLLSLPEDFAVPVIVVCHRTPGADPDLRARLHARTPMPVREVEDKDDVAPATIHLAPADYHLLVDEENLALSTEAPVQDARPSVDVLFESAADSFKARVTAVLLGGAGPDGVRGLGAIKRRGGHVIAEQPAAEDGAPGSLAASVVDAVLPVAAIGPALLARLHVAATAARSELAEGVR